MSYRLLPASFGSILVLLGATQLYAADLSIKPGDQVVRIEILSKQQLDQVLAMDLDVWSHELGLGPLDLHVSIAERQALEKAGFALKVLDADLSRTRARELAEIAAAPRAPGDFLAYKNLADIVAFINNLAATRPDLCQVIDIGNSVEGRDIWVLKITGPNAGPKPGVLYHGLIHAREWITAPVVMYLADHLVSNYDTDPCIADLVNRTEFYLVPCVNPDGYNYTWTTTRLWRKNRRNNGTNFGVDLNRNFGYQWGYDNSGSSGTTSSETYRGPGPFSEPETQAIRDLVLANANIKAYMDYHSYSQLLMWPWGYISTLTPDNARFAAVGNYMQQLITAVFGTYYEPGPVNTTIYPANGVSIDWVYGGAGRFPFTIELRDTGATGFLLPADQILPTCQENLAGILYLSRWASAGVLLDLSGPPPAYIAAGVPTTLTANLADAQETYVPGSGLLYYRFNPNDSFTSTPLTLLGGTTYTATLPAASCGDTAQFYLVASGNGGYSAVAPCGAPSSFYSAPVMNIPPAQVAHTYNMSVNPLWATTSQWAFGTPSGTCSDPTSGFTGATFYAYNLAGCYPNNLTSAQYLTTTAIDCSNLINTQLRFRRWLRIESSQYDHANVQVSSDGANWTTVWNFTGPTLLEGAWSLQTYDISAVADRQPAVYVRWGMGPTDSSVNYGGWNIDDVEMVGSVIPNCLSVTLGDVNGDAEVDAADIELFTDVLLNPGAATSAQQCAADVNQNCGVTIEDVEPFVELLIGV